MNVLLCRWALTFWLTRRSRQWRSPGGRRRFRPRQPVGQRLYRQRRIYRRAAAKALRYRSMLRAEHIRVFADSHVKHGSHAIVADRSIQELTRDVDFFEADAVIATGQRTGDSATMAEIDEIRAATELPLWWAPGDTG